MVSVNDFREIIEKLFDDAFETNKNVDYKIFLSYSLKEDTNKRKTILNLLDQILNTGNPVKEFSKLIKLLSHFHKEVDLTDYEFIKEIFRTKYLEKEELTDLLELLDIYEIDDDELNEMLKEEIIAFLDGELKEISSDLDVGDYISRDEYESYYDEDGMRDEIFDSLEKSVIDFNSHIFDKLGIDTQNMVQGIDLDEIFHSYIESTSPYYLEGDYSSRDSTTDDIMDQIDDLFDRG